MAGIAVGKRAETASAPSGYVPDAHAPKWAIARGLQFCFSQLGSVAHYCAEHAAEAAAQISLRIDTSKLCWRQDHGCMFCARDTQSAAALDRSAALIEEQNARDALAIEQRSIAEGGER